MSLNELASLPREACYRHHVHECGTLVKGEVARKPDGPVPRKQPLNPAGSVKST